MSKKKDDLTNIEDLSEYFHDESEETAESEETPPALIHEDESNLFNLEQDDMFSDDLFSNNDEIPDNEDTSLAPELELDFEIEPEIEIEPEPEIEETEIEIEPEPEIVIPRQTRSETFEEIKNFAKNIQYGDVSAAGNPPFSLIIKNIIYKEDSADILIILREHGLISPENEETITRSLSRGSLLISQISEYSAIYLCHRLRRFNVEIIMGLSDEIHPPKSYTDSQRGLVNKNIDRHYQKDYLILEDSYVNIENISLTTTSMLEGHSINKYLGIVSEHTILNLDQFDKQTISSDTKYNEEIDNTFIALAEEIETKVTEIDKNDSSFPDRVSLNEIYINLAEKLKPQALKLNGNAIIGINYQITPLVEKGVSGLNPRYKISCTGNVVWATRN